MLNGDDRVGQTSRLLDDHGAHASVRRRRTAQLSDKGGGESVQFNENDIWAAG
jgi:hypothetical protein